LRASAARGGAGLGWLGVFVAAIQRLVARAHPMRETPHLTRHETCHMLARPGGALRVRYAGAISLGRERRFAAGI